MKQPPSNAVLKSSKCTRSKFFKPAKVSQCLSISASRVNRSAVAFIQANQPDQALACIKRGLRHILQSLLQTDTESKIQPSRIASLAAPAIEINEEHLVSPDGVFAFYNNAFTCLGPSSDESVLPLLLYNLGLIYHRQAIERGSSPRLLRAALKIYRQAQMLGGPDAWVFAVMNNMGHALSCLFEHEAARACQHHFAVYRHRYRNLVSPEDYCILQSRLSCAPMA